MKTSHLRWLTALLALSVCAAAAAAPAYDEYGGWHDIWGQQTGFFHLEKIRDRWWFITPTGNVFLAKGVEAVNPAPGDKPAQVRRQLATWDFNSVGPHAPRDVQGEGLAYTLLLGLSQPALAAGGSVGRKFPDVFDPGFERMVNEVAQDICAARADDPWLLGYFSDDGLEWRADGPQDLVGAFFATPRQSPAKRALVAELRRRHSEDLNRFNAAWNLSLESWEQLGDMRDLRPGPRFLGYEVSADRSALLTLIAERYFEVVSAAIRAHDPHHLLLGCRFREPPAREVLAAMRQRMDAVSVEWGADGSAQELTQMYSDSGLPLLITPLRLTPAARGPGPARDPAAIEYQGDLETLAKQAFVIGSNWPCYSGGQGAASNPEPALVSVSGEPRGSLVDGIERSNRRFYMQASFARLKPTLFEVVERYELRRCAAEVHIDGDLKDWGCAMPMVLRPSAYESDAPSVEGSAYLMWDAGALYFAGRLYDPARIAVTVTSYVGADWLELETGPYRFMVTLRPGAQTVTDSNGRTREASLIVRRIPADPSGETTRTPRGVAGYTFEGMVRVSGIIPQGLVIQFGLALHHYTADGREVALSFPYYWSRGNPRSSGDVIVTGPLQP